MQVWAIDDSQVPDYVISELKRHMNCTMVGIIESSQLDLLRKGVEHVDVFGKQKSKVHQENLRMKGELKCLNRIIDKTIETVGKKWQT